jgi:hypothetical protein
MTVAAIIALLIHLIVFVAVAEYRPKRTIGPSAKRDPIVLDLQDPPPPEPPRQFIDAGTPTEEEVEPTDLISETNSKASDMSDVEGERPAPFVEQPDTFDQFRGMPQAPAVPPQPPAAETPPMEEEPEVEPEPTEPEEPIMEVVEEPPPPPEEPKEEPPAEPKEERIEVAAVPTPQFPVPEPGRVQARPEGGVESLGFLGFEAQRHEFAPYLKIVRDKVERRWKATIQGRYSGTNRTKAVIDCSIAPNGEVKKVEIVFAGDSASYAALCKAAIEKSGPFPPFPFEVPAVYKKDTLDIRWTFNYL